MNNIPTEQELHKYLNEKGVENILTSLLEYLCFHRPEDVPSAMVDFLHKNYPISYKDRRKVEHGGEEKSKDFEQIQDPLYDPQFHKKLQAFSFTGTRRHSSGEEQKHEDENLIDSEVSENIRRRYSITTIRRKAFSSEPIDVKEAENYSKKKYPKTEDERMRIKLALSKCGIFAHYDKEDLASIYDAMFEKKFNKGDIIIKQGDKGDNFYIVDSGTCEIYVKKEGVEEEQLVKTVEAGDYFGELALMYGTPRAATIIAKTDVKLWGIDRITFRKIIMNQTLKKRAMYEEFLKNVKILENLTDYERLTIADALNQTNYNDGDVIVRQGEQGHSFYIIVEGECVVTKEVEGEGVKEMMRLHSGDYFGELALIFDQPRAATVTAVGPVKCVKLNRRSFKALLGPCEDILKRNMKTYHQYISTSI